MGEVVRLLDRTNVAVDDYQDLMKWLLAWQEGLASGDYGEFRSVVIILESKGGGVSRIAQSTSAMDTTRLVGLLQKCCHQMMDGNAQIEDLRC